MSSRTARAAMSPFEKQMKSALQNALSATTGGAVAPEDIFIKPEDWENLLNQTANLGDEFSEQTGARRRAIQATTIQNFGQPKSEATPNIGDFSIDANVEDAKAVLDNERKENRPMSQRNTSAPTPNSETNASETLDQETNSPEMNEDQGLKHCPYDGQILNSDGTCPAGDHNTLGADPNASNQTPPVPGQTRNGQTPPPIPPQARGGSTPPPVPGQTRNGQTPPPIPPATIAASIQAEGNKKMADLNKKLEAAQEELADLKKKSEKTETKAWWLRIAGGCSCITVILPIITSVFLFLNYQKKGKIEKEINRVEEQITNINKERTETAKKYRLKI